MFEKEKLQWTEILSPAWLRHWLLNVFVTDHRLACAYSYLSVIAHPAYHHHHPLWCRAGCWGGSIFMNWSWIRKRTRRKMTKKHKETSTNHHTRCNKRYTWINHWSQSCTREREGARYGSFPWGLVIRTNSYPCRRACTHGAFTMLVALYSLEYSLCRWASTPMESSPLGGIPPGEVDE